MKDSRLQYPQIMACLIISGLLIPIGVQAEQASLGPSIADKARQAVQDVQDNGAERKEVFYNRVRDQLQRLDSQLAVLKDKGDVLREKTRSELIVQLDKITLQKNDILPRLELATRSSEAAWQDVKQGIDQAVEDLKIAVDQATSNFF
ncbi:MAG: hypothetical protein VST68_05010 [Nitrospirota bacterium]|nr:hypothetical protein [Nitrospirota bacterium]